MTDLRQRRKMKDYVTKRVVIYRPHDIEFPARMGNLATNEMSVTGKPGSIYVTLEVTGQVREAINNILQDVLGMPVIVGYIPNDPLTLRVLRENRAFGSNNNLSIFNGTVGPHHEQHEYPNADTVWVWGEQFLVGLPTPSGLSVVIYPRNYRIAGAWKTSLATTTLDLTSYVPSTAGKAKIVLIVLNSVGTFAVRDGTEISGYDNLADANIPEPVIGDMGICAVKLFTGQTAIRKDGNNNDFIDFRFTSTYNPGLDKVVTYLGETIIFSSELVWFGG